MINFENSDISNIVIHHVGNKFEGGGLTFSAGCFQREDRDVVNLLKSYLLSAFKKDAYYNFLPYEEELMNNPVYASVSQIFDNESEFYQQSVQIAEHLFEQSNNPNITMKHVARHDQRIGLFCGYPMAQRHFSENSDESEYLSTGGRIGDQYQKTGQGLYRLQCQPGQWIQSLYPG